MQADPHAAFILAAYGATALVVAALILRAVLDHRVQVRALKALEPQAPAAGARDRA